jgi:hypothetical protein
MIIVGKHKAPAKPQPRILVLGPPKATSISTTTKATKRTNYLPLKGGVPEGRGGTISATDSQATPTPETNGVSQQQKLLDTLAVQKQNLYIDRAKLSNYYEALERKKAPRTELAQNYDQIEAYTRQLAEVAKEIAYVERFGKSSEIIPEDNEGIRLKIAELKNQRRSLINRMSKRRGKIKAAKAMGNHSLVATYETEMLTLERQKLEVDEAINELQHD